ncbi:pirin family protein [Croceicoccus hydrothermalis]|uniref:pirin family protein n=1 Tax=Croceicoccus hydrothermalis TaxID=2867964 RepID=UPI001EFB95DB|nr:pirin family protein [Croceicoccus hydrothermalis]
MTDPILKTVTPISHDLGAFTVHRAVPQEACRSVGPFVFVDEFGPSTLDIGTGMDVRPHPHIGLSTVTYLLEGAIEHRDSLGSRQVITPGAVNLMTAGRGIVHSERSPADERAAGPRLFGTQTWLALPDGKENIDPAFESIASKDLPIVSDGGSQARIIMGTLWGKTAPTTCHTETINADIELAPDGSMPIGTEVAERAILLLAGDASIDGVALDPLKLIVLRPGAAAVLSSREGGRVFLLGGEPVGKRYVWWNFVHSSRDRIEQAKEDWRDGKFPRVPGDEAEYIPLPDRPKTVSYP